MQGKPLYVAVLLAAIITVLAACSTAPSAPVAAAPTEVSAAAAAPAAAESAAGAPPFVIDAERSRVRFTLDELLRNTPTTVVGETNAVEGSVSLNLDDYSTATIAPIRIDGRTFVTDNNMRNGAIRRFILQTDQDQYQYIVFTPTAIDGLPSAAAVGAPFDLTVAGDLQIRDITKPVSFGVTVTPVSATEIEIAGKTVVARADFDLQIPSVPNVANVEEEVELEIDLVLVAQ